jgi:hypothetical protein
MTSYARPVSLRGRDMLVYRNTTSSVIYFDREEVISPITSTDMVVSPLMDRYTELWPPLVPGDYTAIEYTSVQTEYSRIEEILIEHGCPATGISGLSKDWPDWAYIEMAKLDNMVIKTSGIQRDHDHYAGEIGEYLREKMPHKDPLIVYAQDVLGALWLRNVKDKFWSKVLWPELQRYAKRWNFAIKYSKDVHYGGVDLKVYFIWNNDYSVGSEPWDSFERLVKDNDKYYVGHPLGVKWGVKSSKKEN